MKLEFRYVYEKGKRLIKRIGQVLLDAAWGFVGDDCYAKASALTFYSLLSVVPVLAVLFGIAKGFGFEKALEAEISQRFIEQKELLDKLIQFAYSSLQNTQSGLIAGIGTIVLFWSVFGLLGNVESALNSIWKTQLSRPYSRRIPDYLGIMFIAPIVIIASSSLTVFLTTQVASRAHSNAFFEALSPIVLFLLHLSPFFLIWALFTCVYLFMPYTKVYLRSALLAGILAGTIFQIWQWAYIRFQIGAASYGAIYGSFAALPLFLVWLQMSWMIFLAGAELAFEIENDLFVPLRHRVSLSRKAVALLITYRCIEAFHNNQPPPNDRALSHEMGMSLNHLHTIVEILQREKILSTASYRDKTIGYQPARSVDLITTKDVCDAVEKNDDLQVAIGDSSQIEKIKDFFAKMNTALDTSPYNQPLYQFLSNH